MTEVQEEKEDFFQKYSPTTLPVQPIRGFWDLREEALVLHQKLGLPKSTQEAWRFTDMRRFNRPFEPSGYAEVTAEQLAPYVLKGTAALVVAINGRIDKKLSRMDQLPKGLRLESIYDLCGEKAPLTGISQLEKMTNCFTAINTAFFHDGLVLRSEPGSVGDAPIQLLHVHVNGKFAGMSLCRTLIELGESSHWGLIETHVNFGGKYYSFSNSVAEIYLAKQAQLKHHAVILENGDSLHLSSTTVEVGENASYCGHTLLLEGDLARRNLRVILAGKGAACDLYGLYAGRDKQHQELWIEVDHQVPLGTSRQSFKGVLDGEAHGVFSGKVIVQPGAAKTDALQRNRNLLLSDQARVDSKPQLEIYADDVKCGHGASTGELNEDALFYLQSRGLDPETAREILIYAFAHEILDKLSFQPLVEQTEQILRKRFAHGKELGELA